MHSETIIAMKTYRIALLPGDGIGKEVVPAAVRVLKAAQRNFTLSFEAFDWGCEYYLRAGRMMPPDGLEMLRPFDAILLGATGHPRSPTTFPCPIFFWECGFKSVSNLIRARLRFYPGWEPPCPGRS